MPELAKRTQPSELSATEIWLLVALPAALLIATGFSYIAHAPGTSPLGIYEALGFATGGACVWLCVRQHLWNWPLGLANNVMFFALFLQSRLYGEMALQVVFFGFGVYGWWNWLCGGAQHNTLTVSRAHRYEWLALVLLIPSTTWLLCEVLSAVKGAAPLWDALSTVISLAAQYLMSRKRVENWLFWIVADLILVPLYFSRGLYLTALLFAIFLTMSLIGGYAWWQSWRAAQRPTEF